jgi:hypothetical protein
MIDRSRLGVVARFEPSNVSVANKIAESQTGSQRPQTQPRSVGHETVPAVPGRCQRPPLMPFLSVPDEGRSAPVSRARRILTVIHELP